MKKFIYLVIFLLSGCGDDTINTSDLDSGADIGIIDYRSAYIYEPDSPINKLLISVNSRTTVNDSRGERSYIILKDHPRESTFDINSNPYTEIVSDARGASFITFMYGVGVDSVVVNRRYSVLSVNNQNSIHECRPGKIFDKFYKNLLSSQVFEIKESEIYSVPLSGASYFGSFEYRAGNSNIKIDFPVALVNFNPINSDYIKKNNLLFQVVSSQVPIYLEGNLSDCDALIPGYLAFRSFDGGAQVIYLCKYLSENVWYYDYGCIIDVPGKLKLYGAT